MSLARNGHGESIAHSNKRFTNATNPTRRCSTSWLSSTTPAFKASLEAQGQHLPRYIQQEFNDLLQCGRLEYGFHAGSLRGLSSRASGRLQL
ncbi:hypothetical protein L360_05190 [Enterobacter sp. MGH 14]|nr:hypothetical protein L360_05190 [Enterobacter sp. MGH 14]